MKEKKEPGSVGAFRDLSMFEGYGYDKGASMAKCALWVLLGDPISRSVWCPTALRKRILCAFGARIGNGVIIRNGVRIHWPWKLTIGENAWIGVGVWLLNLENITVGSNVCISQEAMLCTGSHVSNDPHFEFDNAPILVDDGVWIAARATVLRGVTVGKNSVIGATALVARNVEENTTLLAVPATSG